jgi:hypothetical protein
LLCFKPSHAVAFQEATAWVRKEALSFSFLYHLLFPAREYGGASLVGKHLGPDEVFQLPRSVQV